MVAEHRVREHPPCRSPASNDMGGCLRTRSSIDFEIKSPTELALTFFACGFLTQSDYDILVRAIEIMAGATLRDQTAR
ncbi:MAG: hypothetical protein GDA56_13500 [Hormoscilla sp. GM7CHS1pb]|nr:hypothetical protein [Hormoscilla sp. GM7CHS1pb]